MQSQGTGTPTPEELAAHLSVQASVFASGRIHVGDLYHVQGEGDNANLLVLSEDPLRALHISVGRVVGQDDEGLHLDIAEEEAMQMFASYEEDDDIPLIVVDPDGHLIGIVIDDDFGGGENTLEITRGDQVFRLELGDVNMFVINLNVPESATRVQFVDLSGVIAGQIVADFEGRPIGTVDRPVNAKQFVLAWESVPFVVLRDIVGHIDEDGTIFITEEGSAELAQLLADAIADQNVDDEEDEPKVEDVWVSVNGGLITKEKGFEPLDATTLPTPMTVIDSTGSVWGRFHGTNSRDAIIFHTDQPWENRIVPTTAISKFNLAVGEIHLNVTYDEVCQMELVQAAL